MGQVYLTATRDASMVCLLGTSWQADPAASKLLQNVTNGKVKPDDALKQLLALAKKNNIVRSPRSPFRHRLQGAHAGKRR